MIVTPITHEPIHKPVWDVHTNGNGFPGLTVWDVHTNGNVFLGLTVWEVHTNGNFFPGLIVWDVHKNGNVLLGLTVCDIHTNGNVLLGFTVWDVHMNGNNWVSMPRPIAHELIFSQHVCQDSLSPTVSRSCGKDHPIAHTHSATVPNVVAERG